MFEKIRKSYEAYRWWWEIRRRFKQLHPSWELSREDRDKLALELANRFDEIIKHVDY